MRQVRANIGVHAARLEFFREIVSFRKNSICKATTPRLDDWLGILDFAEYDIETWSFHEDAARLFVRGQWALHKNSRQINLLWRNCSHLGSRLNQNLDYKLRFYGATLKSGSQSSCEAVSKRCGPLTHTIHSSRTDATKGKWNGNSTARHLDKLGYSECGGAIGKFVSAEGYYSCVVLASDAANALNLKVKISPLVLSGHNNWQLVVHRPAHPMPAS
mmetsp:Transcript_30634/g.91846  ORF Transcript_30634/g.91846 Transcript_30634/m.91846 type:complete len:217 (-) Transcript_30634:914-1564(-)